MALIKEDELLPLQWALDRVLKVHPGKDNVVRVATVKAVIGVYLRPVRKFCALPMGD